MKRALLAALLPLGMAACKATSLPEVLPLASPIDPVEVKRSTHYHSPIGDYSHRNPVDPEDWRKLNDGQVPGQGGES